MVRHGGIVTLISNKIPLLGPFPFRFLSFFLLELEKKYIKRYFDDSCALEVR